MIQKIILILSLIVVPQIHSMDEKFESFLNRYVKIRLASDMDEVKQLENFKEINKSFKDWKDLNWEKAELKEMGNWNLFSNLAALSELRLENKLNPLAEIRDKVKKLVLSEKSNCVVMGHPTSCTNYYYILSEFADLNIEKIDMMTLKYPKGKKNSHFLKHVATTFEKGIDVQVNLGLSKKLFKLAELRPPLLLSGRGYEFTKKKEFMEIFKPWLSYLDMDLKNSGLVIDQIHDVIKTSNHELTRKIRECLSDAQKMNLILDALVEFIISTHNLKSPRKGWVSCEAEFAWKAVMDFALPDALKLAAEAIATQKLLELAQTSGSRFDRINSVEESILNIFNWDPEYIDQEYEEIIRETELSPAY